MNSESLNELALFAGAGGGILGGILCGFRTVCAVEVEPAARGMLMARQDDGTLEPFPIWDDVRTFDGKPWRGVVDIVTGGFPCQDISAAGKGAGIEGERSGLWGEMARIIREVGPRYVLVENSPVLTSRGLGVVLGDLASLGYDARWGVLGAVHAGAPHKRERIWIVAYSPRLQPGRPDQRAERQRAGTRRESIALANASRGRCCGPDQGQGEQPRRAEAIGASEALADRDGMRQLQPEGSEQEQRRRPGDSSRDVSDSPLSRLEGHRHGAALADGRPRQGLAGPMAGPDGAWWLAEPDVGRVAHGVAARVDRLRALGNGQVPAVVRLAWSLLAPSHALPK